MKRILLFALLILISTLVFAQRQNPLAQQKMCAEQAHKDFAERFTQTDSNVSSQYTSHYDPKTNTCYVMFHTLIGADENGRGDHLVTNGFSVVDAFERREYASSFFSGLSGLQVTWCYISRPGHEKEPCKTKAEFLHLVDKYFGIGF